MNKLYKYIRDVIYPFLLIIFVGTLLSVIIYYVVYSIVGYNVLADPSQERRLDGISKILGLSISITGFVSIIITIIQSRQSLQRDIQQSSVDLFKELRSEKFIDARRRAWIVKEKWYDEKGYKEKLIKYNFSSRDKVKDEGLDHDMKVVYQLFEFYLLVSVYEGNEKILKALRYFYYGWWRHFLYDFASEIEGNTKTNDMLKNPGVHYLQDISYIATLQRLDILCGLECIPRETVLHFDGG